MGGLFSRIHRMFCRMPDMRILMNGLDAAGKTTILYKLKLGEVITTIPTIGFNVETVDYKNISFTVWDVGGRDKIRPLWRHYYQNTQAVIWVVDSNDRERIGGGDASHEDDIGTTYQELQRALSEHELQDIPVLIFANKQDLPNAMGVQEITERLGLNKLRHREWYVQGCCATSGDGLYEGLDWLSQTVRKRTKHSVKVPPKPTSTTWSSNNSSTFNNRLQTKVVAPTLPTPIVSTPTFKPAAVLLNPLNHVATVKSPTIAATDSNPLVRAESAPTEIPTTSSIPTAPPLTPVASKTSRASTPVSFSTSTNAPSNSSTLPNETWSRYISPTVEVSSAPTSMATPPSFEVTHSPLVQLKVQTTALPSSPIAPSSPMEEGEFILVDTIEPATHEPNSDQPLEWLDAHGHPMTNTAKLVQLRMLTAVC